jgi:hypothetical protein
MNMTEAKRKPGRAVEQPVKGCQLERCGRKKAFFLFIFAMNSRFAVALWIAILALNDQEVIGTDLKYQEALNLVILDQVTSRENDILSSFRKEHVEVFNFILPVKSF